MKTTGYIGIDGKYHRGESKAMGYDVTTTHKEWRHDFERKQFAKEIIQPFKSGKPNKEFVDAYPEQADKFFDKATLDKLKRTI